LRVHSEFSLVDSVITIKDLVSESVKQGMPAIALTDLCNFYGLVKFTPSIGCLAEKAMLSSSR
ncbi:MAG: PHP domain-containing protein, partial [Bacteroidota bacterium]